MGRKSSKAKSEHPTIQVGKDTKDRLVKWIEDNGKPGQGATVDKLLLWFMAQEPPFQRIVTGQISGMEKSYAEFLRSLARKIDPPAGDGAPELDR